MAQASRRRDENVAGDLFVDDSCIDCDTCRWMAPTVFAARGGQSAVVRQPASSGEWTQALQALISCPTASIGTEARKAKLKEVQETFPIPVAEGVYHCGYHAESSFGATSYLIVREGGNVLVDSPRFAEPLARRIEEMGGARWIFLTHRDDVADHAKWAQRLGAKRVMHADDVTGRTEDVEMRIEGRDPVPLAEDLLVIPVPGHTKGHACLLWKRKFLFTGDHLAYDDATGDLEAWPAVCWYDWGEQTESMRRLLDHDFEWVLPGHGRRGHAPLPEMRGKLRTLVAWMQQQ